MTAGTLLKSFALGLDEQAIIKILEGSKEQPIRAIQINQTKGSSPRCSKTKGSSPRCSIMIDNPLIKIVDPTSYIYKGIGFKLIGCPEQGLFDQDLFDEADIKKMSSKQDIFMGETEVTQELYEAVMKSNPSYFKGKPDSPKRPVEWVSGYDCIDFCNKLSVGFGLKPYYTIENIKKEGASIKSAKVEAKGGNGFRLPTEAEWVMFAKAGTQNTWAGTNKENEVGRVGWYNKNSNDQTHPVAQLLPNEWGLYDMSGNVNEWCWVEFREASPNRISHGGSCFDTTKGLLSNLRIGNQPDARSGFRICRTIES